MIADVDTAALWYPFLNDRSVAADELLSRSLIRLTALGLLCRPCRANAGSGSARQYSPDRRQELRRGH